MTFTGTIAPGLISLASAASLEAGVLGASMAPPALEGVAAMTQIVIPIVAQSAHSRGMGRIFGEASEWIRRRLGLVPPPPPPAPLGPREELLAKNQEALRSIIDRLTDEWKLPSYASLSQIILPQLFEMEISINSEGQFVYCSGLRNPYYYRRYQSEGHGYRFRSGFNDEDLTSHRYREENRRIETRSTILMDLSSHLIDVDFSIPESQLEYIQRTFSGDEGWLKSMIKEATLTEIQRERLKDLFDDPFHVNGRLVYRQSEPYYRTLLDGGWEKGFLDKLTSTIDSTAGHHVRSITLDFAVGDPGCTYRDRAQYQLIPIATGRPTPGPSGQTQFRVRYQPAGGDKQRPSFKYTVTQGNLPDDVRQILDFIERKVREVKFREA